jgi:lipid II:glycine glycyltransferase (peptidoglycan interpeptide bridge formation enzyme)
VLARGLSVIVSALHFGEPVTAAVFLCFGTAAIFKYGASDPWHLGLRPNNLVMWEAIK